jgi:hypothetical protein
MLPLRKNKRGYGAFNSTDWDPHRLLFNTSPFLLCNHSPASSFEVKNLWSFTSTPHTSSLRGDYLSTRNVLLIFLPLWDSLDASRISIKSITLSFKSNLIAYQ